MESSKRRSLLRILAHDRRPEKLRTNLKRSNLQLYEVCGIFSLSWNNSTRIVVEISAQANEATACLCWLILALEL